MILFEKKNKKMGKITFLNIYSFLIDIFQTYYNVSKFLKRFFLKNDIIDSYNIKHIYSLNRKKRFFNDI
jgi:hypothetical protein